MELESGCWQPDTPVSGCRISVNNPHLGAAVAGGVAGAVAAGGGVAPAGAVAGAGAVAPAGAVAGGGGVAPVGAVAGAGAVLPSAGGVVPSLPGSGLGG